MEGWAAAYIRFSHPRRSWMTWNGHPGGAYRDCSLTTPSQPERWYKEFNSYITQNLKAVRIAQSLPNVLALLQTHRNMEAKHQLVPVNHPLGSA